MSAGLRIYVANDPDAPYQSRSNGRYYVAPIPRRIVDIPDILRHIRGTVRGYAAIGTGVPRGRYTQVPIMARVEDVAWGMNYRGRVVVRGRSLLAVLMVYQDLSTLS